MGGGLDSVSSFLGTSGSQGTKVPISAGNDGVNRMIADQTLGGAAPFNGSLQDYLNGASTSQQFLGASPGGDQAAWDAAAAQDPFAGSRLATSEVQNNPVLGQLFGNSGLMGQEIAKEQQLQNQGFNLTPEDQTLYGQMSGNIARQFGQQGNQTMQDLASRGLASAPSGASGAMFSGLAGNQNEMLAQAQQQIGQQRFQNTMQQISQQQNFINSLGQQAGNDINQQDARQLSGVQSRQQGQQNLAQSQNQGNAIANQGNLAAAGFQQATKPATWGDFASAGLGSLTQAGSGGSGANFLNSMGGSAGKAVGSGMMGG